MMVPIYERYLKLNIDGSPIGLARGERKSNYFCTPRGAQVIGWAGGDGIHYCFVRGLGEMVFAVSPMNTPGDYMYPVARDFEDFLRLLLACGDAAALAQVYCWDHGQFDAFLQDNPLTDRQRAVLDAIREKLLLEPMAQPFAYIKALQAGFDYSRIKLKADYYDWVPVDPKISEWKVYFDGGFWGHHGRERAGKEIFLDKQFIWADDVWLIPAIYTCGKGLVVDFCVQVPAARIRSFMGKWQLSSENDGTAFTDEQQMLLKAENPLAIDFRPQVTLNGTVLSAAQGFGAVWNPCAPEGNGVEARSVIRHYNLDPAYGWAIWRASFSWVTKRRPQIRTLSVTLVQNPVAIPGPHFHVSVPGESIPLTHPTTGVQQTLTVQDYERRELSHEHLNRHYQELPVHYIMMSYALSPDLPDGAFTVTDCVRSDKPRQKRVNPNEPPAFNSMSFAIIGVANGPTAIIVGRSGQSKLHAACSAPHFEPADDVEWRMVFHEKRRDDVTVALI